MAGFIIAASTIHLGARYVILFLMLAGVYGSYNIALAWISSTLPRPVEKRAAAIAIVNTIGNLAQIYSPYLYPSSNGPRYLIAMIVNSCFCLGCIAATLILRWCLVKENQKLESVEIRDTADISNEKAGVKEIVDINVVGGQLMLDPGFRYRL